MASPVQITEWLNHVIFQHKFLCFKKIILRSPIFEFKRYIENEAFLIRKHKPCVNQKLDSRQLDIDL